MDSGADDDDWEPGEEDYRSEPAATAEAASAAAAAVAALAGRRRGQDTSGLVVLGKRRRGRQRAGSEGEEWDELYGDDEEVKGERGAGAGGGGRARPAGCRQGFGCGGRRVPGEPRWPCGAAGCGFHGACQPGQPAICPGVPPPTLLPALLTARPPTLPPPPQCCAT